jgi:uncharacterized protein (DUF1501 family)
MPTFTSSASRREFLRRASAFGAYGAAAPLALQLATLGTASAQTASDYRALVCIFLYGGNDCHNTIIPFDRAHHDLYTAARPNLAVSRDSLNGTALTPASAWSSGRGFALHPAMHELKPLFDLGKLSVGFRVGTLNAPTTRADFERGNNLPAKLFSHNDQFTLWQSMLTEGASSGWGGRMGDILAAGNGVGASLTNITVGSSAVFSSGKGKSFEYAMTSAGPVSLQPVQSTAAQLAIEQELNLSRTHLLRQEVRARYLRNVEAARQLNSALASVGPVQMPATPLGASLAAVARVITARQSLGVKRQVFFVSMGGFDTHGAQLTDHPELLGTLSNAMAAFQRYLDSMNLGRQVTTFTASDFGRSLTSNGAGTDHGWGSHMLVMGGAVKPRSWFGELPTFVRGGSDDVGQGRLLPAVSVDQYGATLARWMGVNPTAMADLFPNITRFPTQDLGFMTA